MARTNTARVQQTTKTRHVTGKVAQKATQVNPLAPLIDRGGRLDETIKAAEKELEKIKSKIKEALSQNLDPADKKTGFGERYLVILGSCRDDRVVNDPKEVHRLTNEDFYGVIKVQLTELEKLIGKDKVESLVRHQCGPRSLTFCVKS